MDKKLTYRIRNWSEYNKALIQRGSITMWFQGQTPEKWRASRGAKKRGRPRIYSDDAILCALVIRAVYRLPLRALQGFLCSIVDILQLALPVPCYTRICRRAVLLGQELNKLTRKQPRDIVFDSSGVKVYGEGEWKVRQHGKGKRRTWRKIHLAVCPDSHEIILSELTESKDTDARVGRKMVSKLPKRTKTVYGDGAYDQELFYEPLYQRGIRTLVPPRRRGRLRDLTIKPWMRDRNEAICTITGLGRDDEARKTWKQLAGYHTRSLAETAMSRFKRFFGGDFRSQELKRQKAELYAKSIAMNRMTRLGMPKGHWITA